MYIPTIFYALKSRTTKKLVFSDFGYANETFHLRMLENQNLQYEKYSKNKNMTCLQILWSLITRTFGIFSRHIVITKFQFFSGHFVYFHRWSMLEITLWNMTIGTVAWLSKYNLGWIRTNCMRDGGGGRGGRNGCFCSLRMWKDLTKIWLTSLKLCVSSGLCGSRFPTFSSIQILIFER